MCGFSRQVRSGRWWRWAVLGISFGSVAVLGLGCQSSGTDPIASVYPPAPAYPLLGSRACGPTVPLGQAAALPPGLAPVKTAGANSPPALGISRAELTEAPKIDLPRSDSPQALLPEFAPTTHEQSKVESPSSRLSSDSPGTSVSSGAPERGPTPEGEATILQQAARFSPHRVDENTQSSTPLQSPAPAEETIDLEVALRLAGVGNPTVNLAREKVRKALADQLAARSLLLPSVNIGTNYHLHRGVLQASPGIIRDVNSQSLYVGFGARTLAAESVAFPGIRLFAHLGDAIYEPLAARQQVAARQSDAIAVQNAKLRDVAAAYLELIGTEARLSVLRQGEVNMAEVVRVTEVYAQKGQGRAGDAKRTEARADLLQQDVRKAEEEVAVASSRLCALINLDPSIRLRTPGGSVQPFRLIAEDTDTEQLVAGAVQTRPELSARSRQIRESQLRVRQEQIRPLVPILSVGFSGGFFGGGSNLIDTEFGPMQGRTDFDVLAVWNIQNLGFGNHARVRRADAVVGQSLADYSASLNQIRTEIVEAQADARAALLQINAARASVGISEEGFRLESERIRQGKGLPIETLDSFQQLLDSQQELVRAVIAFNIAQFRLFVAIGSNPLSSQSPNAMMPVSETPPAPPKP